MGLGEALRHPRALAVLIAFAAAWLPGACGAAGGEAVGPANVLLVANKDFPGSARLARHYAKKRGVPASNLVTLALPKDEEIDREAFIRLIRDPLRKRISQSESPVRCIVVFRGVPLRVKETPGEAKDIFNLKQKERGITGEVATGGHGRPEDKAPGAGGISAASVDSELALLGRAHEAPGWVESPFVGAREWPEGCYWVSRLDATSERDVERMIDSSIEAESAGLTGIGYFDARGLTGDNAYRRADEAIARAARLARASGMTAVLENTKELFEPNSCPDAALYWGWYSLSKYIDSFDFAPGAVAVHVASTECSSLREGPYWCRNLIANGAAVTMGATGEPYLEAFVAPDEFLGLLLAGKSVGEAYYATQKRLSWRMVLLGDPLYRPFARRKEPVGGKRVSEH